MSALNFIELFPCVYVFSTIPIFAFSSSFFLAKATFWALDLCAFALCFLSSQTIICSHSPHSLLLCHLIPLNIQTCPSFLDFKQTKIIPQMQQGQNRTHHFPIPYHLWLTDFCPSKQSLCCTLHAHSVLLYHFEYLPIKHFTYYN